MLEFPKYHAKPVSHLTCYTKTNAIPAYFRIFKKFTYFTTIDCCSINICFDCSEHCVVTWTERGIYIFLPQSVQVLLWSEVKGRLKFLTLLCLLHWSFLKSLPNLEAFQAQFLHLDCRIFIKKLSSVWYILEY